MEEESFEKPPMKMRKVNHSRELTYTTTIARLHKDGDDEEKEGDLF